MKKQLFSINVILPSDKAKKFIEMSSTSDILQCAASVMALASGIQQVSGNMLYQNATCSSAPNIIDYADSFSTFDYIFESLSTIYVKLIQIIVASLPEITYVQLVDAMNTDRFDDPYDVQPIHRLKFINSNAGQLCQEIFRYCALSSPDTKNRLGSKGKCTLLASIIQHVESIMSYLSVLTDTVIEIDGRRMARELVSNRVRAIINDLIDKRDHELKAISLFDFIEVSQSTRSTENE